VIIYTPDVQVFNLDSVLWSVLESLPPQAMYLIVGPTWTLERERPKQVLRVALDPLRARFGHVRTVVLAANAAEVEALRELGETPLWCSKGAFLSESVFFPIASSARTFDAIYDAAWADYKRHELATEISSLALITYLNPRRCTIAYCQRTLLGLRHATWLNPPWVKNARHLAFDAVNQAYNTARVGLCLSKEEGIMKASVQYLLAGLPVVTTHNLGGRDVLFDPSYTRWVADDPSAVAEAVSDMARLDLDPQSVRRAVLLKMDEHRSRFVQWINQTIEENGGDAGRWRHGWPAGLPDRLEVLTRADEILRAAS
jgi:hypothetical protein